MFRRLDVASVEAIGKDVMRSFCSIYLLIKQINTPFIEFLRMRNCSKQQFALKLLLDKKF